MQKVRWGILSSAKIGVEKVIPAMQRSELCEIVGLASRDADVARQCADSLGIPRSFGSYQALLDDPTIDAIYNPLPNHLHVPWSIKALEAGKHVLCEKPIGLDTAQAESLAEAAAKYPTLKIMEAFMYRFHPQWIRAKALVDNGAIGELKTVQTFFSYFNDDPNNVRNIAAIGGGGLMDIGCYPISQARYLYAREPLRVCGVMDIDSRFGTDRIASAILDFGDATATFTCATQLSPFQRAHVVGTSGIIEVDIPVNAPPDQPARLGLRHGLETSEEFFAVCDQYTLQGDALSRAILENTEVATPLGDASANMRVIEAIKASNESGGWVQP